MSSSREESSAPYALPKEQFAASPYQGYSGMQAPQEIHINRSAVFPQQQISTTFVIQDPKVEMWSSGLCACFNDMKSCCSVLFCFPIALGNLATRVGDSFCYGCFCAYHMLAASRPYIRGKHNISGSLCDDFLATAFCALCSTCQMYRELDSRGYGAGCCC